MYDMELLGVIAVILLTVTLISSAILSSLYDVKVTGREFVEMGTSAKKALLMNRPKVYKEMKKLGEMYERIYLKKETP